MFSLHLFISFHYLTISQIIWNSKTKLLVKLNRYSKMKILKSFSTLYISIHYLTII